MWGGSGGGRRLWRLPLAVLGMVMLSTVAEAGGPRWSSGTPYFSNQNGVTVVWYTSQPLYFTDPGDLSAWVDHAAADALVAAAAGTWNVSTASLVVAQGGNLDEHVSGANVYLGANGPVFPSDVQAANGTAKQIAVVYDTDGSVTDTLMGGGASDPANCVENAVTEDVDGISAASQITHAVLVLNGRCTGADLAMQMQMQYELTRAFGRVLGVGWSQANDNVFTGSTVATNSQMLHWPLMHPMEIFCGAYAYRCVVQPFTLKVDDVMTLQAMYPVGATGGGKTATAGTGAYVAGTMTFPTGQGMEGVNLTVRRFFDSSSQQTDDFVLSSAVSGVNFQQVGGNPVTAKGTDLGSSFGSPYVNSGGYAFGYIPFLPSDHWVKLLIVGEAINPLYTGPYAVGPYPVAQVTPSGTISMSLDALSTQVLRFNIVSAGGASSCGSAGDGTEAVPAAVAATGWWTGTMCAYGHTAWSSVAVKAGRSFALEVTSVDEQGYATTGKLQPVIGVWASTDATHTTPTVGAQASPMNAGSLGMTTLGVNNATARVLRIGLGDVRGDGRPDYGYSARMLYADAIAPVSVAANGGRVTITGRGFRQGNTVTVNGVAANVLSWTANTIVAVAPPQMGSVTVDVVVTDLSTGGQTTMTGALTYSGTTLANGLVVASVPANGSVAGSVAALPFSVQVLLPDGVTPAVGGSVTVSSTNAALGACVGLSGCVLTANAAGVATRTVTPLAAGTVTLGGVLGSASVSASFTTMAGAADQVRVVSLPSGTVYMGVEAGTPFGVQVLLADGVTPDAGAQVTLGATGAELGLCGGSTCVVTADGMGMVSTAVTPDGAGSVNLTAAAGGGMASASFGALAMPANVLRVTSAPADGAYVGQAAAMPFAVQVMLGDGVTPAAGVAVLLTSSGATLGGCGGGSCGMTADGSGTVSTTVTPTVVGSVRVAAAAGGRLVLATFQAIARSADVLRLVSVPASGSYVGGATTQPFAVKVLLGDGVTPAAGVAVTLTATGAVLGACGAASCVLTADAQGVVSTTVTPMVAGVVQMTAAVAGVSLSPSFMAVSDAVRLVTVPSGYVYAGVPTVDSFAAQVTLADQVTVVPGAAVVVTATNAILNACGVSTCVLTADATGTISTTLTPTRAGTVSLSATSGGGSLLTSFAVLAMPADVLKIVGKPAGLLYPFIVDATPIVVQVLLGDGRTPDPGVVVRVSSSNLSLGPCVGICNADRTCGGSCSATGDGSGYIVMPVEGLTAGSAVLSVTLGAARLLVPFTVVAMPASTLRVVSSPPDGSLVGQAAGVSFGVQMLRGDGVPMAGVATTLTAVGSTLGACGRVTCTVTGDASGMALSTVTPTAAGMLSLVASAGGATASAMFLAVAAPPDTLRMVAAPADGSYVGQVAGTALVVQVVLANGTAVGGGVPVTLTAVNGTLGACGLGSCVVNTDASGQVSTVVTPTAVGTVGLTASAGGGTISTSFVAVAAPPDLLTVLSVPADGSSVGRVAGTAFSVQVKLAGGTNVAGVAVTVTVTATGAVLGCGSASCVVTADGAGTISTGVTPTTVGTVVLGASAGGGVVSASFAAAAAPPGGMTVVSVPADNALWHRAAALPFSVRVTVPPGVPVAVGTMVTVTAVGASLGACGLATCTLATDAAGEVSTTVTPTAVGVVELTATAGGVTASASFTAVASLPDRLQVVSVPADGSSVGAVAAASFSVQVMLGDGTVGMGAAVTVTAVGATLGGCGSVSSCVLTADSMGLVSTTVMPMGVGTVTLTAAAGGGTVSTTFMASASPWDLPRVASAPASGSYAGYVASAPFAVRVMRGDGVTAAAHVAVTVSVAGGTLGACGLPVCGLTTDANGLVSTTVTPTAAGLVTLTAAAGGGSVSATFTAVDPVREMAVSRAVEYVAVGSTVAWTAGVTVFENGLPGAGVPVSWSSGGSGMVFVGTASTADGAGNASLVAEIGPLAAGDTVAGRACAWVTVCAWLSAAAVDAPQWRLFVISGGGQSVPVGGTLQPVMVEVVDTAGHPVAGVPVTIHQAVNGWVDCAGPGRCPAVPVLTTSVSSAVSDVDGLLTVTPLEVAGVGETTEIVVTAGPFGAATASLAKVP